jgi:hypothetical protein
MEQIRTSRSDFDPGRRIISNGNATFKWSKFTKTRLGFFYEGAERYPISYVYNDKVVCYKILFKILLLIFVLCTRY